MRIGIDFDNTIICYDSIFHKVAVERKLISPDFPASKSKIRNHLREQDIEDEWTKMQGYVYGKRVLEAEMFPGVRSFLLLCRQREIPVNIISHKTRYPYMGEKYDLHRAALDWIKKNRLLETTATGLTSEDVFFELTKEEKIQRVKQQGCTHFIDDLPEFLSIGGFPRDLYKILFDPNSQHAAKTSFRTVTSWSQLAQVLFPC